MCNKATDTLVHVHIQWYDGDEVLKVTRQNADTDRDADQQDMRHGVRRAYSATLLLGDTVFCDDVDNAGDVKAVVVVDTAI